MRTNIAQLGYTKLQTMTIFSHRSLLVISITPTLVTQVLETNREELVKHEIHKILLTFLYIIAIHSPRFVAVAVAAEKKTEPRTKMIQIQIKLSQQSSKSTPEGIIEVPAFSPGKTGEKHTQCYCS